MQNNLHSKKGLGWGGDWLIIEHKWHYWVCGNRVSSRGVSSMHAKFLYTYMQIRERGTVYLLTHLVHAHLSLLLTPPSAHHSPSPWVPLRSSILSIPPAAPEWSGLSWVPPKEQVEVIPGSTVRRGQGGREESPEGWIRQQVTLWAQPCWGPSEEASGCASVCPSAGIWVFIHSLPSFPGWELPLGCSSSGCPFLDCPVHGWPSPQDTGEPLDGETEGSRAEQGVVIALGTTQHKCTWAQSWSRGHGAGYPELLPQPSSLPWRTTLASPIPLLSIMSLSSIPCGC